MELALFTGSGVEFLSRWAHYLMGVTWIGLLYYFNFVQGSYFKEAEAGAKSDATKKLVPRALWWFRWGAMFTFASGVFLLYYKGMRSGGAEAFFTPWGVMILMGAMMGTVMFLNVWLVIWPNQKIVIAAATTPNPAAADAGAKALRASRTNTLLSIPMLFFMGAASHLPVNMASGGHMALGITLVIILALEANALKGKLGPMETIKGVITCGFVLTGVLYAMLECIG